MKIAVPSRPTLLGIVAAVLFAGCAEKSEVDLEPGTSPTPKNSNLVSRNTQGGVIAHARIDLPAEFPSDGESFTGVSELVSSEDGFPDQAMESGRYTATVNGDEIYFDLNAGWHDNNIVLVGTLDDETITGHWEHLRFVGNERLGEFVLTR